MRLAATKRFDCLIRTGQCCCHDESPSHTSFDASDAYAQSLFWSQVLDFVEDPDDPNEPEHVECLITSRDRSQMLLFIAVPDSKPSGFHNLAPDIAKTPRPLGGLPSPEAECAPVPGHLLDGHVR